ncbi:MAG TPA: hypothetical protein VF796_17105 [Humisphaera sp.]
MNIFELGFAVLTVGGGIVGGTKGYAMHGGIGALAGLPLGAAAGLAIAFATTFLLAVVCSVVFGGPLFKPRPPKGDG